MANETSYATLLSNGGRVAQVLSQLIHTNLYDPTGLREVMTFYPYTGGGSATMHITKATRGYAMAAASSEISGGFSNTLQSTGNFTLTIARYALQMAPTDLFRITGGALDIEYVLNVLMESLDLTLTDLLCALFPNVSGSVGDTGVDMSVDDFFDAKFALNLALNPQAMIKAVLHQQQVNDLEESIRGEMGPLQWRQDSQEMLNTKGPGYVGRFLNVDIYQSNSVGTANAGADRAGCMFSSGAFAYTLGSVAAMDPMVDPADLLVQTDAMFIERDRDAGNGLTKLFANAYPGVAEAEDSRAVQIVTDA